VTSAKRWLSVASVCAIGVATGGGHAWAASSGPHSMSEAIAQGDPAATAPSVDSPEVYRHGAGNISREAARKQGLICISENPITGDAAECYSSAADVNAAAEAQKAKQLKLDRAAGGQRAKDAAAAPAKLACGQFYLILALWNRSDYNPVNGAFGTSGYHYWDNYSGSLNNIASSYTTGDGSAHLAEGDRGAGYWYPGNTSYCAGNSIPAHYPSWDNRISSGLRNYG
jgi:hypothetical protein